MLYRLTPAALISLWLFSTQSYAGPTVTICTYECKKHTEFTLSDDSWGKITDIFKQKHKTAEEERDKLAKAIAFFERDIIDQISSDEKAKTSNPESLFTNIDETRNTSTAITLLLDKQLIQMHYLRRSEKRDYLFGSEHSTAVIQSRQSGKLYSVDTYSTAFGKQPNIQLLSKWKNDTPVNLLTKQVKQIIPGLDNDAE